MLTAHTTTTSKAFSLNRAKLITQQTQLYRHHELLFDIHNTVLFKIFALGLTVKLFKKKKSSSKFLKAHLLPPKILFFSSMKSNYSLKKKKKHSNKKTLFHFFFPSSPPTTFSSFLVSFQIQIHIQSINQFNSSSYFIYGITYFFFFIDM